jgi:hypothetical protein
LVYAGIPHQVFGERVVTFSVPFPGFMETSSYYPRSGHAHERPVVAEVLDQRGIDDRFLSAGQTAQITGFGVTRLDISDFPTRHNYGLALRQKHIERILAGWVTELNAPIIYNREVVGFVPSAAGVDVALADGQSLHAQYLVGATVDAASSARPRASTSRVGVRLRAASSRKWR